MGHHSWECTQPKKAKGCFRCGQFGHASWNCTAPQPLSAMAHDNQAGQHVTQAWQATQQAAVQSKGKGTQHWNKGKGKGAYEVYQGDSQYWGEQGVQGSETAQYEAGNPGLGGGSIDEVQAGWQVKVTRARSSNDMRPGRWQRKEHNEEGVTTSNRFAALTEHEIFSVDRNIIQQVAAVGACEKGWERIPIKIDSGAIDTVMPPGVARHFKLTETEMSRNGPGFRAANGTLIKHYGQRAIKGWSDDFHSSYLTAQVTDVKTTLGSVNQMLKAGNKVHFEKGNCYVEHATGQVTPILEKAGTFEIGVWVPKSNESVTKPQGFAGQDDRF